MKERGLRNNIKPIDDSAELFKREYLCEWLEPSLEYQEAYKLWLWYNYQCELYDSKICTGKSKYESYTPATPYERQASYTNAKNVLFYIENERKYLREQGIFITEEDWQSAKRHFNNHKYKLRGLEEEYKYYFGEKGEI